MYKVEFTPQAEKDLSRIDRSIAKRIIDKIDWLCQNIEHIIKEPLLGKFKGTYKLRTGDWRIIYSTEHSSQVVTIYAIEHRSKVYKTCGLKAISGDLPSTQSVSFTQRTQRRRKVRKIEEV